MHINFDVPLTSVGFSDMQPMSIYSEVSSVALLLDKCAYGAYCRVTVHKRALLLLNIGISLLELKLFTFE